MRQNMLIIQIIFHNVMQKVNGLDVAKAMVEAYLLVCGCLEVQSIELTHVDSWENN